MDELLKQIDEIQEEASKWANPDGVLPNGKTVQRFVAEFVWERIKMTAYEAGPDALVSDIFKKGILWANDCALGGGYLEDDFGTSGKTYAMAVYYVDGNDFDIFTYGTKEEMDNAYEKASHSYLINGREWHEIIFDIFGACDEGEGKN